MHLLASSSAPQRAAESSARSLLSELADDALLERQRSLVVERRRVDSDLAAVAGEIARRSDRSLGFAGLAARLGARSPEQLIAQETGVTVREAGSLVRVGAAVSAPDGVSAIAAAVGSGGVSVAAADALLNGLRGPGAGRDALDAVALEAAAAEAIARADGLTPEQLGELARDLRAELAEASVEDRERGLRARRALRLFREADGMTRLVAMLDPESAALVRSAFDAVTSPRRGGPRFVDVGERARAVRLASDPRTTEQVALDAFVELVRLGSAVEPGDLVGTRKPAVRVLVTDADLRARTGVARIEGSSEPVSIATAARHICESGTVPILFDSAGQVVNLGRDQRLFTPRQRIALGARDGGCVWPGCDRPPSWCEAHHIDEWKAHGGRTDVADGVLLCRFHHLYVHDQRWRIVRGAGEESATYTATRGTSAPVRLVSKSAVLARLRSGA